MDEHYISTWPNFLLISRVFVPKAWIVAALVAEHTLCCMESLLASTGDNLHVCCDVLCICEQVIWPQLGYGITHHAGQALAWCCVTQLVIKV